jgi:carboxypeptidase Taq
MTAPEAYQELIHRSRQASLLGSCVELLGWDEDTYMPRGGVEHRASQLAFMAGLQHERATDPRLGELLGELETSDLVREPLSVEAVNIRHLRRAYGRASRLPRRLVEETARVSSLSLQEWAAARQHDDYARLQPWLEQLIVLKRNEAEAIGYQTVAYDALLDEYEPDARSQEITQLFDVLRGELAQLLSAVLGSRRGADRSAVGLLHGEFPLDRQRTFAEMVAGAVGFDFQSGRLDETPHPFFSTIGPGDCRISTRYHPHYFGDGFFSMLHEVGHGLYEQGLDPEHFGTPMGEAVSLGMHEAMARMWENTVGRSRPFWKQFFPLARRIFHEVLADARLDKFYFAVNHVAPSLIRVQADEITYNLHIMLRFELEQALLSGALSAADLPAAWNEAHLRYLGVAPDNDADGCLQDGHWAAGMFGYFPTYTLGNVFAAQLFSHAAAELGDLDRQFARGKFAGLLGWLREHIHSQGSRYTATELIRRATGTPPDPQPLLQMLRRKYGELYRLT